MAFKLDDLPYAPNALDPHITANTISFHYGKHHQGYVNKLNELVKGTEFEAQSLTDVVRNTAGKPEKVAVFNNAAQTWNHTFYWRSMRAGGGGEPTGPVKDKILATYETPQKFAQVFKDTAMAQFGSGWTWLAEKDGKVEVVKTTNAENPLTQGYKPLITLDVWEHAYYLDYQNRRADYASIFLDKLVNWEFANYNLGLQEVKL